MRSDQIHIAIAQGNNRYEICRLTFNGVKIIHKRGERMEDSINRVLGMLRPATALPTAGLAKTSIGIWTTVGLDCSAGPLCDATS